MPIWTGKKDDAEHPYQRYEVKATDLTHALKVAQDSYKAEKAAERAAAERWHLSDRERAVHAALG